MSPRYTSLTEDPSDLAYQVIVPCANLLTAAVPPSRAKKSGRTNQVVETLVTIVETNRASRICRTSRSTSRVITSQETLVTAAEAPTKRRYAKKNDHTALPTSQVLTSCETLVTDVKLPTKPSRARNISRTSRPNSPVTSCEKLVSPAEHPRPKRNCRRNFSLAEAVHLIQADSDASD